MKGSNYILKIDNPCQQEWSSMTKNDSGKYCSFCSKTVVDFTKLSDNEIIQLVEKTSGKLCGRLSKAQLGRILGDKQIGNNSRLYKILAGFLLVGSTKEALATDKLNPQMEIVSFIDDNGKVPVQQLKKEEELTDSLKNLIQGNILDSLTKEPLYFATILIKATNVTAQIDQEGKFNLIIPDSLVKEKIQLEIKCLGYENKEMEINISELPVSKDIVLVPVQHMTVGEICVVRTKKRWQFWKR